MAIGIRVILAAGAAFRPAGITEKKFKANQKSDDSILNVYHRASAALKMMANG
jgi:hypothetical protein